MTFTYAELVVFIATPSQNIMSTDLVSGVKSFSFWVASNPNAVMAAIDTHPYIAASYLLEDLAEKITRANTLNQTQEITLLKDLNWIYDAEAYRNKLLSADADGYIYTPYDLKRCIAAIPAHRNDILQAVCDNDLLLQRIFTSAVPEDTEKTLAQLTEDWPEYAEAFTESYDRTFCNTPRLTG
ncbi:MAG: hypothetical protein P1U32_04960 [Legionellaceae bacterium]|nr:hypothetical protein [Legionellaceae bacterium]